MKTIFISDIHGLIDNFKKIQPIIEESDKIIILGDSFSANENRIIGEYNPNYLFEYFNNNQDKIIYIKGNCDHYEDLNKLNFPTHNQFKYEIDNKNINLIHNPNDCFSLNNNDIVIFGHTHIPEISRVGEILYINPGSLSLPKNEVASYLIYENNCFTIYDIDGNVICRS